LGLTSTCGMGFDVRLTNNVSTATRIIAVLFRLEFEISRRLPVIARLINHLECIETDHLDSYWYCK